MKKWLAALAALVIGAHAASATTYYVNPAAWNDLGDGQSITNAWKNVSKANTTTRPGDIVYLMAGMHTGFPNPDSGGSNPTGNIVFLAYHAGGDATLDTLLGDQVRVPGGTLSKPYVTLRGVHIAGDLNTTYTARFDSLQRCRIDGTLKMMGSDYNVIHELRDFGPKLLIGIEGGDGWTNGNQILNSTFYNLGHSVFGQPHIIKIGESEGSAGGAHNHVDSMTVDRCRFMVYVEPNADQVHPCKMHNTFHSTFSYCRWDVWNAAISSSAGYGTIVLRDSTSNVTFNADSFYVDGPSSSELAFCDSGSWPGTVTANTVDSCVVMMKNGTGITFQNQMSSFTLTYSTVMGSWRALDCPGNVIGPNVIDHNTLVAGGTGGYANGVVSFANGLFSADSTKVTNNIIANLVASGSNGKISSSGSTVSGLFVNALSGYSALLVADGNLYHVHQYADQNGDRSNIWWNGGGYNSRPGGGPGSFASTFATTARINGDSLSTWGDAQFDEGGPDSTIALTFNPAIGVLSKARGADLSGGDAGAVAYVGLPTLSISPAALRFPNVPIGATDTLTIGFGNAGTANLDVTLTSPDPEVVVSDGAFTIAAAGTNAITVTYTPLSQTARVVYLEVTSNDPNRLTFTIPVLLDYPPAGGQSGGGEDPLKRGHP